MWVVAIVIAVTAGCADRAVRAAVVAYAEGRWRCETVPPPAATRLFPDEVSSVAIDATVTVEDDTSGEFVFSINGPVGMARQFSGTWRLDGTDLHVEIPAFVTTSYAMEGVDLDTKRLDIQEDAEGAEVLVVDAERHGDTVEFGWADPSAGGNWAMICEKA